MAKETKNVETIAEANVQPVENAAQVVNVAEDAASTDLSEIWSLLDQQAKPMTTDEAVIAYREKKARIVENVEILTAVYSKTEMFDEFKRPVLDKNGNQVYRELVTFTLDRPVPGMKTDKNTNESNICWVSSIAISAFSVYAIMKRAKIFQQMVKAFQRQPSFFEFYFPGTRCNIVCQPVVGGTKYHNYFTGKENDITNTTIIHEIYNLQISEESKQRINNKLDAL